MTTPEEPTRPDDAPLSAAEALRRGRARPPYAAEPEPVYAAEPVPPAAPAYEPPPVAEVAPQPVPDVEPEAEIAAEPDVAPAGRGPVMWPVALLGGLAIVLAVTLVLAGLAVARHKASERARVSAAKAAQQAAVAVLSADYRQLDANIKRAESWLTPSFRKDYLQLAQQAFGQLARDNHLLLTSTVVGYGVREASPDRVVVLLFVDQVSTTLNKPTPKLAQNRVRMTMRKVDGRWLVAKIDAL